MLTYAPANIAMRPSLPMILAQAAPKPPDLDHTVPAGKWFLNVGILAAGFVIGYLGINNHKKPLGILAIQAGGSIVGAGLVLLAVDAAYPSNPESIAAKT